MRKKPQEPRGQPFISRKETTTLYVSFFPFLNREGLLLKNRCHQEVVESHETRDGVVRSATLTFMLRQVMV
jgi:hypothetical protein